MHIYYEGKIFKLSEVSENKRKIFGIDQRGVRVWFYKKEVRILRMEVVN